MPIPPSGTVTFLFTGIDRSTRLAQRHFTRGTVLQRVTTQFPGFFLTEALGRQILRIVGAGCHATRRRVDGIDYAPVFHSERAALVCGAQSVVF